MISYPPAKINIGLNVVEKRQDGYHNIESVFYPIPIIDILEINKSNSFSFTSTGLPISGDTANNLVVKAFKLIKEKHAISNVSIHLHKQIPMGAGLGGGSADAAYTLLMLNDLFKLKLSLVELHKHALTLGSDCPFFIESTPKFVTGTGHIMESIKIDLKGKYLWIINPEIHVSTLEAYSGVTPKLSDIDMRACIQSDMEHWRTQLKNDFEESIFRSYPDIKLIKTHMYANGALYASMSGSGSTVYGICSKSPKLNGKYPFEKVLKL